MLPKEVLKYAEEAKDVEAAVLEALKKHEEMHTTIQAPPFTPFLPGAIVPREALEQELARQQQQARQIVDQLHQQHPHIESAFLGLSNLL